MKTLLFLAAFLFTTANAFAQSIDTTNTIFGPNVYERFPGSPTQYQDEFVVPSGVDTPFVLYIFNGNPDGTQRVSSASIYLNGVEVVTESEFNQQVASIEKQVELAGEDTIVIFLEITSQPYAFITLGITARDTARPVITITWPPNNHVTDSSSITVAGIITDRTPVTATVNDSSVTVGSNGSFSYAVSLVEGSNKIIVRATDYFNNSSSDSVTVIRGVAGPLLASPANDSTGLPLFTKLAWHPHDSTTISYRLQVATNSNFTSVVFNDSTITDTLRMMTTLEPATVYYWRVNALIDFGRTLWSETWHFTTRSDTVPVLVVAPIDSTIPFVMLSEANKFLYTGANAVQFSVDTTKLNAFCAATIRGRVVKSDGSALPGARVLVLDHPEFGYTFSRSDGMFDLVVNGAALYVLSYEKEGFLPAQREIRPSCGVFAYADTVGLVRPDVEATTIRFVEPMEIAFSSVVQDSDSTRQVVLAFEESTVVEMVLPNGSIDTLSSITVRATEYTVGPGGPNAMPALLPPTSGYTYAANLTADEALTTGATEVRFSKPVRFYVDNFVGFPVGMKVPVGYYRFFERRWVPLEDGRVIEIVDTAGGIASVAVDSAGTASDSARVAVFGITDLERQYLATLYAPGQELMRTPINYFGMYDKNCGIIAPAGATSAQSSEPQKQLFEPLYPPMEPSGSVRAVSDVLDQKTEQDIAITGFPFPLHYSSGRQSGRKAELFITVSGDSVPDELKRIDVEVTVAGQLTKASLPADTNQVYHYIWNGKDGYGREFPGIHDAKIRIGYVYLGEYQLPKYIRNNFALMSGEPIPLIKSRQEVTLWQELPLQQVELLDNKRLGKAGWLAAGVNEFNRQNSTLYFGNGVKKKLSKIGNGLVRIPPGPNYGHLTSGTYISLGPVVMDLDGYIYVTRHVGLAGGAYVVRVNPAGQQDTLVAGLGGVSDLSIDREGNVYCVDQSYYGPPYGTLPLRARILKVDRDRNITLVAGESPGYSGDGGPATDALLNGIEGIAVAQNGDIYVTDNNNRRVRRIGQDGIITTVAGGGANTTLTDGMIATEFRFFSAYMGDIAVGNDGSVYIKYANYVYRLGTDGRLYHFAGGVVQAPIIAPQDGTPAKSAELGKYTGSSAIRLAIEPGGSVHLVLIDWNRVFAVDGEGLLRPVIGTGVSGEGPLGKPPLSINMTARDLTFSAFGTMYFTTPNALYAISPFSPSLISGQYEIASSDGGQVYVFDSFGRHIKTRSAFTGFRLFSYTYDAFGRLTQIMDRDSLVSTIERDSTGKITAIISPKGERTVVGIDSLGMLASVTNPNGEDIELKYAEGGLLNRFILPGGGEQVMTYDSTGKLLTASTAEIPSMELQRTQTASGYQVTGTSPTGLLSTMIMQQSPVGAQYLTGTDGFGRTTTATLNPGGVDSLRTPDGTLIIEERGYDPKWGLQSPIAAKTTVKTPSGLTSIQTQTRVVTQWNGSDVGAQRDSTNINGRGSSSVWYKTNRTITKTSAENRKTISFLNTLDQVTKDSTGGISGTSYTYDAEGRVSTMKQGTRTTTYTYDTTGRLATTTDPTGRRDSLFYDAAGRVTRQVFADGRVVLYEYDSNGNLTGITPPGRPEHSFTYDGDNRPLSYTPPVVPVDSLTPTFYEYDDEGRLKKTMFADSTFISVAYDTVDGKQRAVTFDRGTTYFEYDSTSGNLKTIVGVSDDTLLYSYDGSLPVDEIWRGKVNGRFSVKYDNSFRVIQEKVNGVDSIAIQYDKDDLPIRVGSLALKYNTSNSLLLSDTVGSVITDYTYSSFGELTGIKTRRSSDTLFSTSYTRDSLGRITALQEKVQGITNGFAYTYDLAGRLEEVYRNDTLISAYSYDSNGNRVSHSTSSGVDSGSYDSQDRLSSYAGKDYVHTPNGYLRYKIDGADSTTFSYDNYGNLVSVRLPDGTWVQYLIDAANRRIGKKIDSVTVQKFLYSGDLRIVAELDSADQITTRYVYATRENVPEYMVRGGTTYRFVLDHLGSVRLVINASTGDIAQRLDYDEFGRVFFDSNPGFQPFGYAGGLFDTLTALVRFGARDYDPETGRWTAKDPIGFEGEDENLYSYVANNPTNKCDVDGALAQQQNLQLAQAEAIAATQRARVLGRAGEVMAGITKNTQRIESLLKPGAFRVPDVLDKTRLVIGEVKNVKYLSLTKQLRDYLAFASKSGYRFDLYVRQTTELSRQLLELVDQAVINLMTF